MARKRVNFYLDLDLLERLKALKQRVGIPESEAVRRAVAEYLFREESTASKRRPTRKRG